MHLTLNRLGHRLALSAVVATGLAFGANLALPADGVLIEQQVAHEIRMYPKYSIFDNVNIRVENGHVELLGQVSEPYKKSDLQRLAAHVSGVSSVTNELEVLPLSPFDDRIRLQVARAVYRDPMLSRYSLQAVAPIHIIVDNGHVTLEGVVDTKAEKDVAGIRASGAGLSFGPVVNNLLVENPSRRRS